MTKKEIMTPTHSQWEKFMERLQEACKGRDAEGNIAYYCDGTLKNARRVLEGMDRIDVEKSLEYFQDFGGFCDCEIGLNVYDEDA